MKAVLQAMFMIRKSSNVEYFVANIITTVTNNKSVLLTALFVRETKSTVERTKSV